VTVPTVERGLRARRLLLDRDGGRQAVDLVDIRLLHHLEELAGIGRQRLDVAALALGIDRVEGERGLARAGQAGQHDEAVARQVDVDVLEIVLAGAANGDELARGTGRRLVGHGTLFRKGGAAPAALRMYAFILARQGAASVNPTVIWGVESRNGATLSVRRFRRKNKWETKDPTGPATRARQLMPRACEKFQRHYCCSAPPSLGLPWVRRRPG
jgi:hypothetical protein